jgi:hypothetical protein
MIGEEIILALVAFWLAVFMIWFAFRLSRGSHRSVRAPKQPVAVCGCSHHHSFHDPTTSECHALMNGNPVKFNSWKEPTAFEQVRCTCRQYSGPVPLPEFFAPELGDGT